MTDDPTDNPTDTTKDEAFTRLATAIGDYLDAVGWTALVVGNPRIQQPAGSQALNYEFVVRFTGGQHERHDQPPLKESK